MGKDVVPFLPLVEGPFSLLASPLSELASVTLLVGSPTFNGEVGSLSPSKNLLNMLSTVVVIEVFNVSKATLNSPRDTVVSPSLVDEIGFTPECSPSPPSMVSTYSSDDKVLNKEMRL